MEKQNSDSNDSDYDGNYFPSFNRSDDVKFKSHDMYQDDNVDQEDQFDKINSAPSTCDVEVQDNRELKRAYPDSSDDDDDEEYEEKPRFRENGDLISCNKDNSDYNVAKRNKRQKLDGTRGSANTSEEVDYEDRTGLTAKKSSTVVDGENIAQRIMRIMGHKAGHGLGKNKQGRLEPVAASKQHGRRGLGHHVPGLENASLKWVPAEEEISVREDMSWLKNSHARLPSSEEMHDWLEKGPRKRTIDDETNFCDPNILKNVINSKTIFDKLDKHEMRHARTRSNPYETIRGAFFLNRAAVKMANMDKACNFMFTSPDGLKPNELLYFADVCAGPGGFSEYVLWRKKWRAKGFGFTLKNENDFKLTDFYAGPCETFHPFYGPKENGDVFDPSNQEAFKNLIMKHTNNKGVHFMMSDGGFSVEGQENIQEILSKQLYLCQCLVALMIVRTKGNFVTKLFDIFTPFSAGLVYLMYRCFDEVCIFKPNSSRPANSERYLICKGKRPGIDNVIQHLKHVNHILLKNDERNDVTQLVPLEELKREQKLVHYLRESNDYLGRKQIVGLCKIAAFCEDSTLIETKQADMRKECLEYWKVPDESRTIPRSTKPQERLKALLKQSASFIASPPKKLTKDNIAETILDQPYDWFYVPCGTGPAEEENKMATFYMGMGRRKVYRYTNGHWAQASDITLELPPDTLLYAEMVYEMRKEFKHQQKVHALHVIDALFLGGEDISQKYLTDRHELIRMFCEALWKPDNEFARVRVKDLYPLRPNINEKLQVKQRTMKNNRPAFTYEFTRTPLEYDDGQNDVPYFKANSILFLRSTAQSWSRYYSIRASQTYVFNKRTEEKKFERDRPAASEAGFIESFEKRVIWYWPNDDTLSMETVVQRIKEVPSIIRNCNILQN